MNDDVERAVRVIVDQVEAWHDRTHHSVGGTFATCMHDPCANVQRAAARTGRRERHLRLVTLRSRAAPRPDPGPTPWSA